jgi:hypothetical protein
MRTHSLAAVIAAGFGLFLPAVPALAQHSFGAEYDESKPITVTGVVSKVDWENPHMHFYIDVTDDAGNIVHWKFEELCAFPGSELGRWQETDFGPAREHRRQLAGCE